MPPGLNTGVVVPGRIAGPRPHVLPGRVVGEVVPGRILFIDIPPCHSACPSLRVLNMVAIWIAIRPSPFRDGHRIGFPPGVRLMARTSYIGLALPR